MNTQELKKAINSGDFDETFVKLYTSDKVTAQKERYINAINQYVERFGDADVNIYSTPGRTEIGGNHTDHNLGTVLAASVNMDVISIVAPNDTNTIDILDGRYGQMKQVSVQTFEINPDEFESAISLIKGVCRGIENRGGKIGGFNAFLISEVLSGSGLSSSAAFEVAIGTILNHEYNNGKFTQIEIAQIGQYAENVFYNKPSGLMDQMACSVGSVLTIDFADNENPIVSPVKFDLDKHNLTLCVVNSGGSHSDLTQDYSDIKNEMCSVAKCFGKDFLGQVNKAEFIDSIDTIRDKVGDRAILRAIHFYAECDRSLALRDRIEADDVDGFLSKVIQGGHSSFEYNQNAYTSADTKYQPISLALCVAQDMLQDQRAAWRLQGGGFAGTIQCFMDKSLVEKFNAKMGKIFGDKACYTLSIRNYGSIKVEPSIG